MMLKIKVKPRSREQKFEKSGDEYIISLKSEPRNNKANIELIKLLSRHFKIQSANIKIKKGKSSKNKIVEIIDK